MAYKTRIAVEGRENKPPGKKHMNPILHNQPIDYDATGAEVIAFATSKQDDATTRWTELRVYWLACPRQRGRPWRAEVIGMSTHAEEKPKLQWVETGTLTRALKLFGEGRLSEAVIDEAWEWVEAKASKPLVPAEANEPGAALVSGPNPIPNGDADALTWLYGETDGGRSTFATMLSRDFDVPARTVTEALKQNTEIRIPLRAALRWINRDAFRAGRKGGNDG